MGYRACVPWWGGAWDVTVRGFRWWELRQGRVWWRGRGREERGRGGTGRGRSDGECRKGGSWVEAKAG
jgi:hypothetical protein